MKHRSRERDSVFCQGYFRGKLELKGEKKPRLFFKSQISMQLSLHSTVLQLTTDIQFLGGKLSE